MTRKFALDKLICLGLSLMTGGVPVAFALDWVPTTGGEMNDPANWNATEITSSDTLRIKHTLSGDVYLTADLTANQLWIGASGAAASVPLNLGAENTFSCSTFYTYPDAVMYLKSGTIVASGTQRVGHNGGPSRLVLDGPTAKYVSTSPSDKSLVIGYVAGHQDNRIEVLNGATLDAQIRFGYHGACRNSLFVSGVGSTWATTNSASLIGADVVCWGNSIVIADGGRLIGDFALPNLANVVSNELVLCGVGTTWDRGGSKTTDITIGGKQGADYTQFVVSNGVEFAAECNIRLAATNSSGVALSTHNRLLVADGAKLSAKSVYGDSDNSAVEVTGAGSCLTLTTTESPWTYPRRGVGNVLRLADGGTLKLGEPADAKAFCVCGGVGNGLAVDGGTFDVYGALSVGSGDNPNDAFLRIANNGALTHWGDSDVRVGDGGSGSSNVFEVVNGGTFVMKGTKYFRVGYGGEAHGNRMLVDNGTVVASNKQVIVGNQGTARDNEIIVRNGGRLDCNMLYVGRAAPYSRFVVENARVNVSGDCLASREQDGDSYMGSSNAVVRVAGTNVAMVVAGKFTLSKTATLIVDVTGPQVTEAMLTAREIALRTGAKIRITSSADLTEIPTFTATVLKSTDADMALSKVSIEVDPDCGLVVRPSDAKTLVVRHKRKEGLSLIFR